MRSRRIRSSASFGELVHAARSRPAAQAPQRLLERGERLVEPGLLVAQIVLALAHGGTVRRGLGRIVERGRGFWGTWPRGANEPRWDWRER